MRKLSLLVLACFSGGCAYEGTIVRKEVRPLPFSYSLGLDAIYDFELRGSDGQVHRQMVPAAVFANYEVGDYFSEFSRRRASSGLRSCRISGPRRDLWKIRARVTGCRSHFRRTPLHADS